EACFFERMRRLEFLPNSPTLMNAGLTDGQIAACFVLPIRDDLDSIFTALGYMARIHQTGGGTGFSFSSLRPAEDRVRSTGGIASGPISFMELFDHTTAVIRQGGRRRGANMAVLRVDHPDIEAFINAKRSPGRLENFNLSVGMTNDFFAALDSRRPFALRNPRTGRVTRTVNAADLFDAIVEAAWAVGDPGLLFLDEINRHNPTPALGQIETTNPCGEQPLLPYESCTLGSINLAAFPNGTDVDWQRLKGVIRDAIVFLDNVIEANCYPFQEIEMVTRRTRKIGLGVMGLAELLARIGIAYDSDESINLGTRIAAFLHSEALAVSRELGEKRGSFPAFHCSVWPQLGISAQRNATVTCVAPTGTISLIAGTSGGIEPYFALALERRVLDGRRLTDVNPLIRAELVRLGTPGEIALRSVQEHGSLRRVTHIPEELRRRFPIALEIAPEWHVRMQAAFQAHVDAAVSKTVNLPHNAPVSAVREVFTLARQLRLKGVTVYRYGSRAGQTLSLIEEGARPDCRECAV
ncbi:MAG TPA: adenosylcobalamin-dependent ribonucleoside-diphosphate reductase, partial [Candidatus Binatia bacterium]|nr:adenosylcobalamin-dependent ribonucleoside-diphosphate reductase [Candidatus Binatia bacterium]